MPSLDEAIVAIETAFAEVPRPTDEELLHPRCVDDSDLVGLYPYADWRDLPDEAIEREYAALSFLSAAGYRCFIPAYVRYALRHPRSGAAAVDSTIWSLIPEMYDGDLVDYTRSKFSSLTSDERRAIEVALEALAPIDQLDAAQALASWRASS